MTNHIRFGTYNVGQGWNDYTNMVNSDDNEKKKLNDQFNGIKGKDEFNDKKTELLDRVESVVAEKLANQLDVISLQEVITLDREFTRTLQSKGFKIVFLENDDDSFFSTAVAIRESMFKNIVNCSFKSQSGNGAGGVYGQEIAAVEATLKNSDAKLRFSSLHSWGFQLYHPDQDKKNYSRNDVDQAGYAIDYAKEAVNAGKKSKAAYSFIGADMNNNLDNDKRSFTRIEKGGYSVLEPDQETNVNRGDASLSTPYKYRKIDYLFAAKSSKISKIWNSFVSLFKKTSEMTTSPAIVPDSFDFTVESNCSDHKPVVMTITIAEKQSTASKVWKFVKGFFKS